MYVLEKGHTSFCDGHGTRYWKFTAKKLKRNIIHSIETFDNDLVSSKKYHCFIDYSGFIGIRSFDTDSFRDAVNWMIERLRKFQ